MNLLPVTHAEVTVCITQIRSSLDGYSATVWKRFEKITIAVLNMVFKNGIRKLSRFLFLLIPTNIWRASCQLNLCAKLNQKHGILKAALSQSKTSKKRRPWPSYTVLAERTGIPWNGSTKRRNEYLALEKKNVWIGAYHVHRVPSFFESAV